MKIPPPPWVEYDDEEGRWLCQWDGAILTEDLAFIIEVKLTQCQRAYRELRELYLPVAEIFYNRPVAGIVICRTVKWEPEEGIYMGLDTMPEPDSGEISTWLLRI